MYSHEQYMKEKEQRKRYYLANREKIIANTKKNYLKNRDKIIARTKKYNREHSEHRNKLGRERYAINKNGRADYHREYRRKRFHIIREWNLRNSYGIGVKEYERILTSQSNKCAICDTPAPVSGRHFPVDHDHSTGKVRGILCHTCNHLLGYAKDSEKILLSAIRYLRGL